VTTVVGRLAEPLPHMVGTEDRRPTGSRVHERGLDRGAELLLGREVGDGVVDEHTIEGSI
jgi:hypothetical protein